MKNTKFDKEMEYAVDLTNLIFSEMTREYEV